MGDRIDSLDTLLSTCRGGPRASANALSFRQIARVQVSSRRLYVDFASRDSDTPFIDAGLRGLIRLINFSLHQFRIIIWQYRSVDLLPGRFKLFDGRIN